MGGLGARGTQGAKAAMPYSYGPKAGSNRTLAVGVAGLRVHTMVEVVSLNHTESWRY